MINPFDIHNLQMALGVYTPQSLAQVVGSIYGGAGAEDVRQRGGMQRQQLAGQQQLQGQQLFQQHDLNRMQQAVKAEMDLEDAALRRRPQRFRQDMNFLQQRNNYFRTPDLLKALLGN